MSYPFRHNDFGPPPLVERRRPAAPFVLAGFLFSVMFIVPVGVLGPLAFAGASDNGDAIRQFLLLVFFMGVPFGLPAVLYFGLAIRRVIRNRRIQG